MEPSQSEEEGKSRNNSTSSNLDEEGVVTSNPDQVEALKQEDPNFIGSTIAFPEWAGTNNKKTNKEAYPRGVSDCHYRTT